MNSCSSCIRNKYTCDIFKKFMASQIITSANTMPTELYCCSEYICKNFNKQVESTSGYCAKGEYKYIKSAKDYCAISETISQDYNMIFNCKPIESTLITEYNIVEDIQIKINEFRQNNANIIPNVILMSNNKIHYLQKNIEKTLTLYKGVTTSLDKSSILGLEIIIVDRPSYMKVAKI